MTGTDWVCDSCHTNNLATAQVCRVCQCAPGSAVGQVREVPRPAAFSPRNEQQPTFGASRHAEFSADANLRPRITMASTPAPVRPPRPPDPDRPGSGRVAGYVLATLLAVVVVVALVANFHTWFGRPAASSSLSPGSPQDTVIADTTTVAAAPAVPAGPPCPSAVAMYLANSGTDATLVVSYTSTEYDVTLCRDDTGNLYYDGQFKGAAPSNDTHISIPAQQTATGFTAYNNGYTYDIGATEEVLWFNGATVKQFALTRTGP
ncbi:MAG TPA: hypothetical protein VF892_18925 [Pseudonocardiaceae bacterium]